VIQTEPGLLLAGTPGSARAPIAKLETPSSWIWVPYVWLFFGSTRTLSTWLNPGHPDSSSGSLADELIMPLLIVLGLYLLNSRAERTKDILTHNKWVLVLFTFMALSIIWSVFPGISLRRCIRSMGTLVMVVVVLTEHSPLGAIRVLLRRTYLLVIPLSIIAIKYFRNIGVAYNWSGLEEDWVGLATDKNSLGQVLMCSGLFFTWQVIQNWPKKKLTLDALLLVLTLWLLSGSKNTHSSTAIIAFSVCAAILLALQFIRKRADRAKRIIVKTTIVSALFVPFVYLVFAVLDTTPATMILTATGRDMTFTDRTLIWADLLHISEKRPIAGVGIGALWVGPIGYATYPLDNWSRKTPGWRPEQGHNGYIDVYVELGVIGVVLLLIVIAVGFSGALDDLQSDFAFGSLRLVILLSIVMNNITETSFLKGTHDLWFLCLLLAINVPRPRWRGRLTRTGESSGCLSNRSERPHSPYFVIPSVLVRHERWSVRPLL
jgi:exopolysaccharide production protein ExoQ